MAASRNSVLVVEDDLVTREIVIRYLDQAGFITYAATTGEEALAILRREGPRIDWLFTDIVLPGVIDGWIVGAEFHLSYPLRPVVYATATAERSRSQAFGSLFVLKPYSPASIVALFRKLADGTGNLNPLADGPISGEALLA